MPITAIGLLASNTRKISKIIDSAACPCTNGIQTVESLIYECGQLNNERRKLIADISKQDHWSVRKSVLVNKYLKQITHFTKLS
jgi:hypothetical protein